MGSRDPDFAFDDEPDEFRQGNMWTIERSPEKGNVGYTCISRKWLGLFHHWSSSMTVPCRKTFCPFCKRGVEKRWNGYILARNNRTNKNVLFAFTKKGLGPFIEALEEFKSMREVQFLAGRAKPKNNGKVVLQFTGKASRPGQLAPEQDIKPILLHILQIDEDDLVLKDIPTQDDMSEHQIVTAGGRRKHKIANDPVAIAILENVAGSLASSNGNGKAVRS